MLEFTSAAAGVWPVGDAFFVAASAELFSIACPFLKVVIMSNLGYPPDNSKGQSTLLNTGQPT